MTDTILLKSYPASESDLPTLQPGEYVIDPAARRLGTVTGAIPLGRELLPEPVEGQPDWVYKWGGSGVTIGPLPAGGGGRANSGGTWQAPGVAIVGEGSVTVSGVLEAEVEIQRACEITKIGTLPEAASGYDFGIRPKSGFAGITLSGGTSVQTIATTSLIVDAGRYTVFVEPLSMMPFHAVRGATSFGAIQDVPVFLELSQ